MIRPRRKIQSSYYPLDEPKSAVELVFSYLGLGIYYSIVAITFGVFIFTISFVFNELDLTSENYDALKIFVIGIFVLGYVFLERNVKKINRYLIGFLFIFIDICCFITFVNLLNG